MFKKNIVVCLKSGFSFGIETIEKGVKMDGIRIHKMINTAGVAVADGIALMEKKCGTNEQLGCWWCFLILYHKLPNIPMKRVLPLRIN